MKTKTCTKCQETKTLDNFYKLSEKLAIRYAQQDGIDYYCKYCRNGSSLKSHRGGNKKKCTVSGCETHHYAKGMCRNHYTRMRRNGDLDYRNNVVIDGKIYKYGDIQVTYERKNQIKAKYNIDYDTYLEMAKDGCNICGEFTERHLQVDHDHICCSKWKSCGKCVRGVLCNSCNQSVGKYDTGLIRPDHPLYDKIAQYVYDYHVRRYDSDKKQHNAIIADNLEEFIAKLDKGNK